MNDDWQPLIAQIHDSPWRCVLAVTGGGSMAIAALLRVPRASSTVLEAVIPYAAQALVDFLKSEPEQYCSARTARAMAMVAWGRTIELQESPDAELADARRVVRHLAGLGCTASLASQRPKRGRHRAFVALQTADFTETIHLQLQKDARSRPEEEWMVAQAILARLLVLCGAAAPELPLLAGDRLEIARTEARPGWRKLLLGGLLAISTGGQFIRRRPTAPVGEQAEQLIFPGAFHPLHEGHRQMAEIASRLTGKPAAYELSIQNVDKPPLDYTELERRLGQFPESATVWLTRAPTFLEKARLFPGCTFVVGADTIVRIADPRYYGGQAGRRQAIKQLAQLGCRFLVFGRAIPRSQSKTHKVLEQPSIEDTQRSTDRSIRSIQDTQGSIGSIEDTQGRGDKGASSFQTLADLRLPSSLRQLCQQVPEDVFRLDLSSTQLRRDEVD